MGRGNGAPFAAATILSRHIERGSNQDSRLGISLTVALPGLDPHRRERGSFTVHAVDQYRAPLAGAAVRVSMFEGPGAVRGDGLRAEAIELVTDEYGEATFHWSPPEQPPDEGGGEVRVTVSSEDSRVVDLSVEAIVEYPWV